MVSMQLRNADASALRKHGQRRRARNSRSSRCCGLQPERKAQMMECTPAPAEERKAEVVAEDKESQLEQRFQYPVLSSEVLPISPSCSSSTDSTACSDLSEEEEAAFSEESPVHAEEVSAEEVEASAMSEDALDSLPGEPLKVSHQRRRSRNGMSLKTFLTMPEKENRRPAASVEVHDCAEEAASSSSSSTVHSRSSTPCSSTRRVQFNMDAVTVHDICPYSEVYGIHPRTFDFDKHFWMVPARGWPHTNVAAQCGLTEDDENQSDSDSDGEWEVWEPAKDGTHNVHADGLEVE
mmetsp:Transcript_1984/g.3718  ORF Transcript_1984/g.3718 Transcript_1984/m.3718 type:complete len:294 (-) Transcript_1984:135-1016(-)|eukprot:CAMPEP_0197664336 /NCGR_PEP_ID=MMETSP1338-20131121/58572_1 /TAXON_ID=43686 ORGANISM="Pelagodinium beii, Strain RCC1491" /NCGR_SAMPLE_ID=MMETSP1338 /ASSEMBLY_ACC=CAM_ASM_000754 /LENGTH=293 /DNA_ID=CAMNT_0043242951 /DNA_START=59 /DNA_END=940 /DNA_ORIENTATION=-